MKPSEPYAPRPLTRRERGRNDLYTFYSPKNDRLVSVANSINFALALKLEFDPVIRLYVERPRSLALSTRSSVDISFWASTREREERFFMTVLTNALTKYESAGTVTFRRKQALEAAAAGAGLTLAYVGEDLLIHESIQVQANLRLLPYLQASVDLHERGLVKEAIEAAIAPQKGITFDALEDRCSRYDQAHVRAVVAMMIAAGEVRIRHPGACNRLATIERVEAA
jgi:hypothetical protein